MNVNAPTNQFQTVKTEDSSTTFWSDQFQEHCHSLSGARSETDHNYILATNLLQRAKEQKSIHICEIGFGTGLGYQQTALHLEQNQIECQFDFTSFEINENFIMWAINHPYPPLNRFIPLTKLKKRGQHYYCNNRFSSLSVLLGDVLKNIDSLKRPIDIIFQDPFSPNKNPTLWTSQWFKVLYEKAAPNCIMTTYSSAGQARRAMEAGGWKTEKFPGFAKKKESLRAFKKP